MKKMKGVIKETINRRYLLVKSEEGIIKMINPKIRGWRNYYKTKQNGKWMRSLDWYILCTFVRWYNKKHQRARQLSWITRIEQIAREKGLQKMAA